MNYILKNARKFSFDIGNFNKEEIYIKNGKIVEKCFGEEIDIKGAFVYPGFVDSHCHLLGTGFKRSIINLDDVNNRSEFDKLIKNCKEEIVVGRGWDENKLGFLPTRDILDSSVDEKPVILTRRCGHIAVLNSFAIEEYELSDLDGLDETDIKKGIFKERGLGKINKELWKSEERIKNYLEKGIKEFIKYGVTSVHTDDLDGVNNSYILNLLSKQNKIKIYEKYKISSPSQIEEIKKYRNLENIFFKVRAAKLFMDGSLGGRTAALTDDYSDDPGNRGVLLMDRSELIEFIREAEKNEIELCIHMIGDHSLEEAISAFESFYTLETEHRLIHVQIASKKQLQRIKKLNLRLSIQPAFYSSDLIIAEKRLGKERFFELGYPFNKMRDLKINISFSTDSPIENASPFKNIASADHFFSRIESLYYYSEAGKKFENQNSSVELIPGNDADLFVSETDILNSTEETLSKAEVVYTLVNGKLVYKK
jgi:hypothetical protein